MISTKTSESFTQLSLQSLFDTTFIRNRDKVVLIDNDGTLSDMPGVRVVKNEQPRSFAQNANFALGISHVVEDDVFLLNNDIVFTKDWVDYCDICPDRITIPSCNQDAQYQIGDLNLSYIMKLDQYSNNRSDLEAAAELHRSRVSPEPPHVRTVLMPFFCVHLPYKITKTVGYFDELFGRGGGEDVDYRIRALKQNFDVVRSQPSFILHFMGKSTWLSGENIGQTKENNEIYWRHFERKWGHIAAQFFLAGSEKMAFAEQYNFAHELSLGDFSAIVRRIIPE